MSYPGAIALLLSDPCNSFRQIDTIGVHQRNALMREHALLSGTPKRTIAFGTSSCIKLPSQTEHLVEFVRWKLVAEGRRRADWKQDRLS